MVSIPPVGQGSRKVVVLNPVQTFAETRPHSFHHNASEINRSRLSPAIFHPPPLSFLLLVAPMAFPGQSERSGTLSPLSQHPLQKALLLRAFVYHIIGCSEKRLPGCLSATPLAIPHTSQEFDPHVCLVEHLLASLVFIAGFVSFCEFAHVLNFSSSILFS